MSPAGRRDFLALLALLAGVAGAAGGCGSPPVAPSSCVVAFASSFDGFHGWPSAPAMPAATLPPFDAGAIFGGGPDGGPGDGGVHTLAETIYWHWPMPPATGSTTFPLGTIIVKETNEADPTARQVFALVKRGCDFDSAGAVNWEWFELQNNADGTVNINWGGDGPPSGSTDIYGANPNVCNNCHQIAVANDYIWSSALQLSNF